MQHSLCRQKRPSKRWPASAASVPTLARTWRASLRLLAAPSHTSTRLNTRARAAKDANGTGNLCNQADHMVSAVVFLMAAGGRACQRPRLCRQRGPTSTSRATSSSGACQRC
eukprot:15484530-Alexandrium_andersonii.AAC.2